MHEQAPAAAPTDGGLDDMFGGGDASAAPAGGDDIFSGDNGFGGDNGLMGDRCVCSPCLDGHIKMKWLQAGFCYSRRDMLERREQKID